MTQARIEERSASIPMGGESHEATPTIVRASERLWNLRWPTWQFGEITATTCAFGEAVPFIVEHFPKLFPAEPGRFLEEGMTPAKRRFLDDCDVMLFREAGRVVGMWAGNPLDWSTYYVRNLVILPDCRQRGIMNEFVPWLGGTLRAAGVERVEADTAPTNLVMNRSLLRAGWIVTSTVNSDRWGTLLRYTKFLTPASQRCFQRQFLVVSAPPEQDPVS